MATAMGLAVACDNAVAVQTPRGMDEGNARSAKWYARSVPGRLFDARYGADCERGSKESEN